jgi:MFS family permease
MGGVALRYFAADFASLLGNAAMALTLPWLVLARTGDAAATGLVAFATATPAFLAAVIGGTLIDRFGRRSITIVADVGSAASVTLLFLVDSAVGLTLGWFIVLGILGALFDVPGITARQALLPEVASAAGLTIERATGIRQALFGAAFLLGPLLAGLGLAVLPAQQVLLVTAALSLVAAALTVSLPRTLGAQSTGFRERLGGIGILAANPVARAITILGVGSVVTISPLQAVVLPVVFQRLGEPFLLGATLGVFAIGLIAGSLLYGALRLPRRGVLTTALLVSLAGLSGFAVAPVPVVIMPCAALVGLGYGLLAPMVQVLVTEWVPEASRGRVLGLQNAGYLAGFPVGALIIGVVVQHGTVQFGAAISAAAWAACVAYGLTTPGLRWLDRAA